MNYQYLAINNNKYPTFIGEVSLSPSGFGLKSSNATHTASVMLNQDIKYGVVVTDNEGNQYKVVKAIERLGKLRLELTRA